MVIATLALLAALMLPTLSQGLDRNTSIKVQCANQLRQLGMVMTVYAGENNGHYLPVRNGNQTAIAAPPLGKSAAEVYLAQNMTNGVDKILVLSQPARLRPAQWAACLPGLARSMASGL